MSVSEMTERHWSGMICQGCGALVMEVTSALGYPRMECSDKHCEHPLQHRQMIINTQRAQFALNSGDLLFLEPAVGRPGFFAVREIDTTHGNGMALCTVQRHM